MKGVLFLVRKRPNPFSDDRETDKGITKTQENHRSGLGFAIGWCRLQCIHGACCRFACGTVKSFSNQT